MKKTLTSILALLIPIAIAAPVYAGTEKDYNLNPPKLRTIKPGDAMPTPDSNHYELSFSKNIIVKTYSENGKITMQEFYKKCGEKPFAVFNPESKVFYSDYKDKEGFIGPDGIIDEIISTKKGSGKKIKIPKCIGE